MFNSTQEDADMVTTTKFLRLPEVQNRTGKSRSSIYAAIKNGTFPKQIRLGGPRAIGFIESEVEAYIQSCIDASRSAEHPNFPTP